MRTLDLGETLIPDGFSADAYQIHFDGEALVVKMQGRGGTALTLEASGVLSYRFSLEEVYKGYIEHSLNKLLTPQDPAWSQRYQNENNAFGDFVRKRRFFHLNIPDVGILECWALEIGQGS